MKKSKHLDVSQKLASEVQLARIRLASAENELKSSKMQSRLAKRRRKEAKEAARRARKEVKLAKTKALDARQALAEAEGRVIQEGERAVKTKQRAKRPARRNATVKATVTNLEKVVARPGLARRATSEQIVSRPPPPAPSGATLVEGKGLPINVPQQIEVTPGISAPLIASQIIDPQPQSHSL